MPDDSVGAGSHSQVTPAPASARDLAPIVELDAAECVDVIVKQRMCILAVVDDDAPYAVPVYYGFDGESLYLGVAEGRKTRALDRNPRVHVVIAEPGPGDSWRSVAVAGRASMLTDPVERARGIEALVAHNRRPERGESQSPPRRRSGGRIIRIDEAVITGRARR